MENKNKKRTLKIRGQVVEVSEEVYRAYIRPIRAEQRRKRREWKCRIINGGHYVRCTEKCETCPYYLAGNSALGNVTSLDRLVDCEVEIEDKDTDLGNDLIELETQSEEYSALHKAISQLTPRQQEMIRMIYFEGKSQEEVASVMKVTQATVSITLNRAIENLRKILKN